MFFQNIETQIFKRCTRSKFQFYLGLFVIYAPNISNQIFWKP